MPVNFGWFLSSTVRAPATCVHVQRDVLDDHVRQSDDRADGRNAFRGRSPTAEEVTSYTHRQYKRRTNKKCNGHVHKQSQGKVKSAFISQNLINRSILWSRNLRTSLLLVFLIDKRPKPWLLLVSPSGWWIRKLRRSVNHTTHHFTQDFGSGTVGTWKLTLTFCQFS